MLWENFKEFFAKPYRGAAEMSATDWFLFLGLLLVIMAVWAVIFQHVKQGIS